MYGGTNAVGADAIGADARSRRAPKRRTRLFVTLAAALTGLLACEVAVRVLQLAPLPRPRSEGSVIQPHPDPVMRYESKPGGVLTRSYVDSPDATPRVVTARVNSQGFRGAEVERARPMGVPRIACIGDSHTFGYGVDEGEAWPHVLERWIERETPLPNCEVLNCGVDAYDSEQEAVWLEQKVLDYEPELVLLGFYVNDTALRGALGADPAPLSESQRPGFWLELVQPTETSFMHALRSHSQFADYAADALYRRLSLGLYARARTEMFDASHPSWQRVRTALIRMRDASSAHGARFVVVLYPFLFRVGKHLASHDAFAITADFCRIESIPCIDLEPAFEGLDVARLRVHPQDYHSTVEAHRIAGEAIGVALREMDVLAGL